MTFPRKLSRRLALLRDTATIGALVLVVNCEAMAPSDSPGPPPVSQTAYYVAPSGSSTGDGSATRPWDLATALAQPTGVQPGDTIWLRGGTYRGGFTSTLTGSAGAPIILRQYPGERATIDGNMIIHGSDTWYWGFEVISTVAAPMDLMAIDQRGPRTKLINLVIHDAGGNGIGTWLPAVDAEIYGSIIYNNGRQAVVGGRAHGIYIQNEIGSKLISDNVLFHNLGFDLHCYGTAAPLKNMTFDGNVGINPGAGQGIGGWLVKTDNARPHENLTFRNNMVYGIHAGGWGEFGPTAPQAVGRFSFTNNYIWAQLTKFRHWDAMTVTGNTFATMATQLFVQSGYPSSQAYVFNNNSYFSTTTQEFHTWINGVRDLDAASFATWKARTSYDLSSTVVTSTSGKPTTNQVFVRPNRYEAGRANIVIYNWQLLGSVSVDVSSVLAPGDSYQVRNVQNFFGTPVLGGTYGGGSLSIPMTAVTPPVPIGGWPIGAPPVSGPEFTAFVVLRTGP